MTPAVKRLATVLTIALLACAHATARGDVKLPAIFGDHMALQGGARIPFWGTADAGETVTVKAAGQSQSATADARGKWRVALDPIDAKEPIEVTVSGKNTITFRDVLVGEVWLCSGQSNMGFALRAATNGAEAVKSANRPTMRLFEVGRNYPDQPQEELTGKWEVCSPETIADFSAVAYFFGIELQQNLNRPVGLIEASWGGTRAETWMPRPTFDALKLPYEPEWTQRWLKPPPNDKERPYQGPGLLYNGMIHPIAGYAIRGVIWYQGETNTLHGAHYRNVLTALITSWRAAWGQGDPSTGSGQSPPTGSGRDFPFLVVQLANLQNNRFWPTLRAAQAQVAQELPNVGLAVTIDVGESKDIHPKDKRTVGHRLALAARKIAYGQDVPYSGPTFKAMKAEGGAAVIEFDHVYDGLVAKGGTLEGFEVAGADGKFTPAKATVEGDRVRVRADGVTSPKAVRYGWANDPRCTLYNKAGLPAVPFEAK